MVEALGSALLGLVVAATALRRLPGRFRDTRLVLATGAVAAAVGGLVTRAVLGPDHLAVALVLGAGAAAALVSLLLTSGPAPAPATAAGRRAG